MGAMTARSHHLIALALLLTLGLAGCWPPGGPGGSPTPPPALSFELAWWADDGEPLEFGAVTQTEATTLTTRVSNVGSGNMAVAGLTGPSSGFGFLEELPLWLEPGDEVELPLQYSPTRPEIVAGFLSLRTQPQVLEPPTLAVRAQGLAAQLDWSRSSLLPDSTEPGCPQEVTLVLRSAGSLPTTVTALDMEDVDSDFFIVSAPELPATLDPGATAEVVLGFQRESPGTAIDRVLPTTEPAYANDPGPFLQGFAAFDRTVADTFAPADELLLSEVPWPEGIAVQVDALPWSDWSYAAEPARVLLDASTLPDDAVITVEYPVVEGC